MGLRRDELQERTATPPPALSPREREILAYVARGGASKEIARDLDVARTRIGALHERRVRGQRIVDRDAVRRRGAVKGGRAVRDL